jgi:IS5 family transposase
VTGANRHDVTKLDALLYHLPKQKADNVNLCADTGYIGKSAEKSIRNWGFEPQVRQKMKKRLIKGDNEVCKKHRWIVEVSHSWFNRFRKLLVRYEKLKRNYEALTMLAAAIITFRKMGVIYG